MGRTFCFSYPKLPPSDNRIRDIGYVYVKGKRKAVIRYTTEAENYKKEVVRHINDDLFFEVQRFSREHRPWMVYTLTAVFVFPAEDLLTAGWLKEQAKSPYKRNDTMNRRKLLQDALAEALGIDDTLFWEDSEMKLVGGDNDPPAVHLVLEEVSPTRYGIPPEFLREHHGR